MLLDLPHELGLLVLRSLPSQQLAPLGRLCCTCKALRRSASTSALWRRVAHSIFPAAQLAAACPTGAPQWRDACRQLLFEQARSRRWQARQRLEEGKAQQKRCDATAHLLRETLSRYEASLSKRPGDASLLNKHAQVGRDYRLAVERCNVQREEVKALQDAWEQADAACKPLAPPARPSPAAAAAAARGTVRDLRHRYRPQFPEERSGGALSSCSGGWVEVSHGRGRKSVMMD